MRTASQLFIGGPKNKHLSHRKLGLVHLRVLLHRFLFKTQLFMGHLITRKISTFLNFCAKN